MKKFNLFLLSCLVVSSAAIAKDCPTCEKVREYNKNHPENNYEYFDEYVFEHPEAAPKSIDEKDTKK